MNGLNDSPAGTISTWFDGRAKLLRFKAHRDARGTLLPLAFESLPFIPVRAFTVSEVPRRTQRGGHAHRSGQQLLVCVSGRVEVSLRCGPESADVTLRPDGHALLIGAGVWASQTYDDQASALMVLASEPYAADTYLSGRH